MASMAQVGSHKTSIFTENGMTKVIYHNTPVVTFNNEKVILRCGGWLTNTTKTRMNQASNQFDLGYSVYQKNHEWYVSYKGKTLEFAEGMVLAR